MIDSNFRSIFQAFLINPFATLLARWGFLPNHITIAAMTAGLMAACALIASCKVLAVILLVLSGLFDATDGTMARKTQSSSDRGCIFDIIGDRVVEAAMILALYLVDSQTRGLPALILLASFYLCITTFLLSGIFAKNFSETSFHYRPGLIERGEVFCFFIIVIIWEDSFSWAANLFSALVFYTALRRFNELTAHPP